MSDDLRTLTTLGGTALVLHRGTDIDIREFRVQDVIAVLLIAYATRRVMSQ